MPAPIGYTDDVEVMQPDEEAEIEETISTMLNTMAQTFEIHRHATSATHAKSHGVLTGELTVRDGLPVELAQGLFAEPATYEVVLRLASEPGQIDDDSAKRARGAALKVLDVTGEKLREGWTSQDFLFNTWPVIPQGDVHTYLAAIKARDHHVGHVNRVRLETSLHDPAPVELLFDRTPNIAPVAHTYYTQGAFRYGDHVAKLGLFPVGDGQLEQADRTVGRSDPPGVLQQWTHDYCAENETRFEVRVQLCTDLDAMPVEDASVTWPEEESPYVTVADVLLPAQETFSPARRVYAEDVMSWRPWWSLAAHRPLGSINRVRRRAYEALGDQRHEVNAREEANPTSLAEVPA